MSKKVQSIFRDVEARCIKNGLYWRDVTCSKLSSKSLQDLSFLSKRINLTKSGCLIFFLPERATEFLVCHFGPVVFLASPLFSNFIRLNDPEYSFLLRFPFYDLRTKFIVMQKISDKLPQVIHTRRCKIYFIKSMNKHVHKKSDIIFNILSTYNITTSCFMYIKNHTCEQ